MGFTCGNSRRAASSRTTVSLRSPSMSGRAMVDGIGVTRCTQYDDSTGVSTGTGCRCRCRPRAFA